MPSLKTDDSSLLAKHGPFNLRIGQCKYGRGVFAGQDFAPGALIEVCPLLVLPSYDTHLAWVAGHNLLDRYYFQIDDQVSGLALGYGSLYNHSKKANAAYVINLDDRELIISAVKPIRAGQQVFIDYGYKPKKK